MTPIETQILTVILWLFVIKFCQITIYPYLKSALGNLSYGLSYPLGILTLTCISWYLGLSHLPVQFSLVPFGALGVYALYKKLYDKNEIKSNLNWDTVFLVAFILMLIVRVYSPGIIPSGEKFMDAAFLGSIMNVPMVTPMDPWFAGENLSIYYYLGHWMMGVLGILSGGVHTVIFNLMLPTVFGLAAVSAYAIGCLVLPKHKWIPILVLILPNAALLYHMLISGLNTGVWWASTRVIENTINEYPLFSFLWGDPHAHVLGCFNQLVFICLLSIMLLKWNCLAKKGKYLLLILLSLSLGTMPAVNSWDVMIYAGVYLAIAFVVWFVIEEHNPRKILPFAVVPILSILSYGPFLLNMISVGGSSVQGFFFVQTPTVINEFLLVYLFFVAVFILYGFSVLKKYPWLIVVPILFAIIGYASAGVALFCILLLLGKREMLPETIFGILGMAIVFMMEFIYLKDYMGDVYYKMNTVFKFGFCAWFMLGVSALLIIGKWCEKFPELPKKRAALAAVLIIITLVVLPGFVGMNQGYPSGTLDGSTWLETMHPSDSAGITYLMEHAGPNDVIVEAAGDSYGYSSRVSAMTGLSTVIGWTGHQVGWRQGAFDPIERFTDVETIYTNPLKTIELMDKYQAKYLFVGEVEREKYQIRLPETGILEVFSSDGVVIYQRSI